MLSLRGVAWVYGPVFIAALIAAMGMGANFGAAIAVNDTQGQQELQRTTQNVSTIPDDIERDFEENTSSVAGEVTKRMIMPPVRFMIGATIFSTHVGYQYPLVGQWFGRITPFLMFGVVGVAFYRQYQQLQALRDS